MTVALSVRTIDLRPTPANALVAGAVSGISGTAAGVIGGPFLALVLQHERPERVRSTLAAFFLVGSGLALGGLPSAGRWRAPTCWPVCVGAVRAARLRPRGPRPGRVDAARFRRYVLGFCVVASLTVIVRAALA